MLRALIFGVDGTLADSERDGHRVAFNCAFADAELDWNWDVRRHGELLRVTGGRERIVHFIETGAPEIPQGQRDAVARRLHVRKTDRATSSSPDQARRHQSRRRRRRSQGLHGRQHAHLPMQWAFLQMILKAHEPFIAWRSTTDGG